VDLEEGHFPASINRGDPSQSQLGATAGTKETIRKGIRVDSGNLRKHSLLVIIVMTSKYIFMHIN